MTNYVTPQVASGAASIRTEAEVRARREALEADMRAEDASEAMITRLATDETAAMMLDYERGMLNEIARMFGPHT